MKRTLSALAFIVFIAAAPALACDLAGPNTHMGVVSAVDPAHKTFTLTDAQTGKPLVFAATPEMLRGLKVKDKIAVVYAADGTKLRATSIKRG